MHVVNYPPICGLVYMYVICDVLPSVGMHAGMHVERHVCCWFVSDLRVITIQTATDCAFLCSIIYCMLAYIQLLY